MQKSGALLHPRRCISFPGQEVDSLEACWGHVAQCKIRATGVLLHSWAVQLREQCPKDFPQHGYGCRLVAGEPRA